MIKIAIGSDHGGYELKENVINFLRGEKYAVEDMGTHSKDACDYPMIGFEVAKAVAQGRGQGGEHGGEGAEVAQHVGGHDQVESARPGGEEGARVSAHRGVRAVAMGSQTRARN